VLPASVSVCEPCALANFSSAIIEIVSPPLPTYGKTFTYLRRSLIYINSNIEADDFEQDGVKPAISGPVDTSDETQALPQFLFPVNFPPSPPAEQAVLMNVAPAPVQPVGNQTAGALQVNPAPLNAQSATNQSAQVIAGPLSAPQATNHSTQATIPSISAPATASISTSPPFKKGHCRSTARGHVCSLPDYIKVRLFALCVVGIPTKFDQMYIFAGLPCPKTTALGDGNVELMVNTGLATRQRRGY
jgi:hypothetical protein